jgi:hypothetical protein
MGSTALRTAVFLIIAVGLILGGILIYKFFLNIFEIYEVPLLIRLAVVAGGLGFVVILFYVLWEKLRNMKG